MFTDTFRQNVLWNIDQITVQVAHAESVKGRARSGYYKAAIILASSIVEALAYKLLENNQSTEMPMEDWECKNSYFLPEHCVSKNGCRLSICERFQPSFRLNRQTDFKKVNEISLKLKLFSKSFFTRIEKVRILRNKIHIQGLSNLDRSYTKRELEFISSIVNYLLGKIQEQDNTVQK